jgi:membrane fusion protein, multidrug efflux system
LCRQNRQPMKLLLSDVSQQKKVALLLLAYLFMGCSKEKEAATAPVLEIQVSKVIQRDVPIYREFVGQVYGQSDIEIRTRVDGWITALSFKEGGSVKKGQLLYTIDPIQYQTKVDQARGQLAAAEATFVNADSNLKRIKPLAEINAVSKRDLDAALANFDASKAQVDAARANLENQKIELSYTRITSPIDGVIGISKMREGNYVGSLGPSGLLNTVSQIESLRVRFPIGEQDLLHIQKIRKENPEEAKKEIEAHLILADGSLYPHKGWVNTTDRQIDSETGTLTIQADFPNPEQNLRPGQFVRIRLIFENRKHALIVPQRAVTEMQGIFQVMTVTAENKLQAKIVQAGQQIGNEWIIDSGLEVTDRIALLGSQFIQPNTIVKPVAADANPAAGEPAKN